MENFYIYIIYSERSDRYYVGYSSNIEARIERHNNPKFSSYTSRHIPWILMASIMVGNDRGKAIVIEKYIKKQKSRKFIEQIIENKENSEFIDKLVRVPLERD